MMSFYVQQQNSLHKIVVWCKPSDRPYALATKKLLRPHEVMVREVGEEEEHPDGEYGQEWAGIKGQLKDLTGGAEFAIFIHGRYVGGYRNLLIAYRQGHLGALLSAPLPERTPAPAATSSSLTSTSRQEDSSHSESSPSQSTNFMWKRPDSYSVESRNLFHAVVPGLRMLKETSNDKCE